MTWHEKQAALIQASTLQREALKRVRWARLDEAGAAEFNEAAQALRVASSLLSEVSAAILSEARQREKRALRVA